MVNPGAIWSALGGVHRYRPKVQRGATGARRGAWRRRPANCLIASDAALSTTSYNDRCPTLLTVRYRPAPSPPPGGYTQRRGPVRAVTALATPQVRNLPRQFCKRLADQIGQSNY